MIVFPKSFVKIKYPGYFWDTDEHILYSIKVTGVLKPLKLQKGFRGYSNGHYVDIPDGYQLSHQGSRRYVSLDYLKALVVQPYTHHELIDSHNSVQF